MIMRSLTSTRMRVIGMVAFVTALITPTAAQAVEVWLIIGDQGWALEICVTLGEWTYCDLAPIE